MLIARATRPVLNGRQVAPPSVVRRTPWNCVAAYIVFGSRGLDGDCGGVDVVRARLEESPVLAAVDAPCQMRWAKPARGVADRGVERLRVGRIDCEYSQDCTDVGVKSHFQEEPPSVLRRSAPFDVAVERPGSEWVDGDRSDPGGAACGSVPGDATVAASDHAGSPGGGEHGARVTWVEHDRADLAAFAGVLPAAFAQVRPLFVLMRIPRDPLASRCALFAGSTATAWTLTPSLSAFQVRPRSPLRNTPR